ncbi:MAG: hypothetical protein ACTJGD_10935 [Mesonia hippocampi]|uniref:hypothetical protein n=1 Tax=Mesonia hippocampi TaxID=1628250 RepID=UPI003F982558
MNLKKINLLSLVFGLVFLSSTLKLYSQEKPKLTLGGALRFNYNLSSWKEGQKKRGGDFGYDMFRINANASYKKINLNAEYRLYSDAFGGGMLKQGWVGYQFNEKDEIQIGLTQVPFGIQRYNSHNWFFNLTYYVGLEDDHDMGVKFIHKGKRWEYHLAFFKNAEELNFGNNSPISPSRYSYDIAGVQKEINQFNGKIRYHFGDSIQQKAGASLQYGGIYNTETQEIGNHHALAIHYELLYKNWLLKAQATTAKHNPKSNPSNNSISMAAYGGSYEVANDFNIYSLAIAKDIPIELGPISNIRLYNDFAFMDKHEKSFTNSYMNVFGLMLTAGQVYTYIDYAAGYNHSWLGGNYVNDFAQGNPDAKWEARYNINIGYYF